jgi:hypothetical protein
MDLPVSVSLQLIHEVFLAPSDSFLAISAAANSEGTTQFNSSTVLYSSTLLLLLLSCRTLLITTLHEPHGKHRLLLPRMSVY